jgi:hypothetical protein
MTEFMIGSLAAGKIARGDSSSSTNIPEPKQLIFELDDQAKKYIETAERNFEELIGQHELEVCISACREPLRKSVSQSSLGVPIRRPGQDCLQGIQGLSGRNGSADQATRLPQTQQPTGSLLRKRTNAQIRPWKNRSHSIGEFGE